MAVPDKLGSGHGNNRRHGGAGKGCGRWGKVANIIVIDIIDINIIINIIVIVNKKVDYIVRLSITRWLKAILWQNDQSMNCQVRRGCQHSRSSGRGII